MATPSKARIFITHSWKDIDFTRRLHNDLQALGYQIWFDDKSLRPGRRMAQEIDRGLNWCDVYMPVLSSSSLASPWCLEEINAAIALSNDPQRKGRPLIIPVLTEDCADQMPVLLRSRLYVNFARQYENAFQELVYKAFMSTSQIRLAQPARPTINPPAPTKSPTAVRTHPGLSMSATIVALGAVIVMLLLICVGVSLSVSQQLLAKPTVVVVTFVPVVNGPAATSTSIPPTLTHTPVIPTSTPLVSTNVPVLALTNTPTRVPSPVPTLAPSATPTRAPAPATARPTPLPSCAIQISSAFASRVNSSVQLRVGCPTENTRNVNFANEPFERGMMFWREDDKRIYVLFTDKTWSVFDDTWTSSLPDDSCPSVSVSSGLVKPHRGFGKVWCDQSPVRAKIGAATASEYGLYAAPVQGFQRGAVFASTQGQVYIFYSDYTWE